MRPSRRHSVAGRAHPRGLPRRAAELVRTYRNLPLGTTDATVIAVCERFDLTEVAGLDRRHSTVVRPGDAEALTLLPE